MSAQPSEPFSEYQRRDAVAEVLYMLAQKHGYTLETAALRSQPPDYIEWWRNDALAVIHVADETDRHHKIVRVQHV